MNTADEVELIEQARAGDEAALGSLLDLRRAPLRQIAENGLPDRLKARVDASDIVQQTCLSVFRQIAGFQGRDPAQFEAWVRQIHERNIQNAIRDQLRTQKRGDGREEALEGKELDESGQISPSGHAMQREEAFRLATLLNRLPQEERDVLRLRYILGRTLADIAKELQLTREAVIWRMQQGMKRLRQWLPRNE